MPARRTKGSASARPAASNLNKVGAVGKALDVLDMIIRQSPSPSAAQISAELELPRPTTNRIIGNLIRLDFLQREPERRKVIEGNRILSLALAVVARAAQRGPRRQILRELSAKTEETCNVGIIVGGRVRYIDRVEAKWPLALRLEPGSEIPLHCTALGKLLLSELPEAQREKYLKTMELHRYTSNTITDIDVLEKELKNISKEGVSFDTEEYLSGVIGMAVPIPLEGSHTVLGLAVAAPSARLTVGELRKDMSALHEAAAKLAICYRSS